MNMSNIKSVVLTIFSAIGSFFVNLFGGWTNDLETLVVFMVIDFITGFTCAAILKKSEKTDTGALESKVGWKGIIKKCYTLLFVLIAHRLDLAIGMDYIKTTVIIGFIINEGLSIIENLGLIGIPLPNTIKNAIEILQKKTNSEQEEIKENEEQSEEKTKEEILTNEEKK